MDIHDSLDRILGSEAVLRDMFLRHGSKSRSFEGVNLQRQAVMLMMALLAVEQFETERCPTTIKYLQELGVKHHELGIPKETYPCSHDIWVATEMIRWRNSGPVPSITQLNNC